MTATRALPPSKDLDDVAIAEDTLPVKGSHRHAALEQCTSQVRHFNTVTPRALPALRHDLEFIHELLDAGQAEAEAA